MDVGSVTGRITEIQLRIAALSGARVASTPASLATSGVQSSQTRGVQSSQSSSGAAFASALDTALVSQQGEFVTPVQGRVSSGFGPRWGKFHSGLDIAAPTGTPVRAVTGGVVREASWKGGYGNAVVIDHGNGLTTLYAHNSAMTVAPGQRVKPGDVIAKVGSTGNSTGPHLHLEVRMGDKKVDPLPWLRERNAAP